MNAATEFDIGPLTWVKSEIDLALERAGEALGRYASGGDPTQLKFCRTHLHQVRGALAIVGLDGVTQFADALEGLIDDIEQKKVAADASLLGDSIAAIRQFLDDLVDGEPNQPLRLLPTYRRLLLARGARKVSPTDLFFPDLSLRPPRRQAPPPTLSRGELQQLLRAQRARFQRGLLAWLRNPGDRSGIGEMLDATRQVEATQDLASARAFWWIAAGMLTAIAEGGLTGDVEIKQLCARIDLQIRRLLEGSRNVAERLMRDALYYVALADTDSTSVRQVRDTYQLAGAIPQEQASATAPHEQTRRRLRDAIIAAEEAWNKFCAGTAQSLPVFREQTTAMQQLIEQLQHTDYRRLGQAICSTANWLGEKPGRQSELLSMEVATAILLAQNAAENFSRLGGDFAHQVDVMVARLHGFLADTPPEPGSEVPLLDEMSRQAQEKLLVGQVAKEIQTNLAQIEQVLDGFFRDAERRSDLKTLDAPLHQIIGALTIMGQDAAVAMLHDCESEIHRFADEGYTPLETDFIHVADRLSALGFFIDAMQHGATDFAEFVRAMERRDEPEAEEAEASGSVEQELEQAKRETQALLTALKEQPTDERIREELKQNLETLKQDADLVADSALGQQAKAVLTALDTGAAAPAIEEAIASIKPQAAEAPTPSAETLQLAQADEEELDAELLAIFIEEAKEVLEAVSSNLAALREQPHDAEVLTNIRRSFHTLKGSGRMVGLRDLGEVAWAIEQVLNLWLRQELEISPQIFEMIAQGQTVFADWVEHLESRSRPVPDARALVALAESLRIGGETPATQIAEPPVPLEDDEMYGGAAATLVLGDFGREEAPPPAAPVEVIEMPPLTLESPSLADDENFDAAAATVVLGAFGSDEAPQVDETAKTVLLRDIVATAEELPPSEPTAEIIDLAPPMPVGTTVEEVPLDSAAVDEEIIDFGELALPDEIPDTADAAVPATDVQTSELAGELADDLAAGEAALAETMIAPPVDYTSSGIAPDVPDTTAAPEPELPADEIAAAPAESAVGGAPLDISPTLYEIFLEEARGHLASLQREFGILDHDPTQPTAHQMARAAHTLAGISATVGLTDLNQLGVALEHALLRREVTEEAGSIAAIEVMRQTIDTLQEMIAGVAAMRAPRPAPHLIDALDQIYPLPAQPTLEALAAETGEEPQPTSAATPDDLARAPAAVPILAEYAHVKDELDDQLLPIFLEEAVELTASINESLRAWRADPANGEAARALHRLFHTLKGSARMAGAMTLGEITHAIETRVEQATKTDTAAAEEIEEIETTFDSVVQIIERLQRGESLAIPAAPAESVEAAPAFTGEAIAAPAVVVRAEPAVPVAEAGEVDEGSEIAAQRAVLRVRADLVDQLVNEAGELSIARARIEGEMLSLKGSLLDLTENVIRLRRQLRDIEIQAETQMQSRIAQADEKHLGFDPLEFDRFTRFQELTRMMAESVNDVATVQQNLLKNLDDANAAIVAQARMNRQLQQELMSVRMVPFSSQAERMYRIVRQTAKELGKRANLEIRGGQVEIDRSVLEKIGAPLEHLLRNAVAHGLEDRDVRVAAGKTDIGEISLTLAQEGNEIILTMADDGAGLDFERIRARGIESGLLAPDEAADEGRLIKLIFTPGFSTATEVNQIAGRGIGMDVVKTEIGELGGRIEVNSVAGKGSTFRLYIPLTLAVTQALLVRVGTHLYAVPSSMIEQVLELKESFLARIREAGEAEWLGNRYPFRFLPHLLGDGGALPEARRQYWVLLLRSGQQRIAVQVDDLQGNREVVIKNIGPQLARVVGIDGATVLGDGQVVLILNPVALASRTRALPAAAAGAIPQEPAAAESAVATLPTVMVVDDSLTVRKITGRLLAREGYQVLTAKDGVDALEQMLDVIPDVLLVDIEMPRMDGFDLTRNVRADAKLKNIPIIMITSRTADKHRNYAFEIGVNNYLGKPYQEDELLTLIREFTATRHH